MATGNENLRNALADSVVIVKKGQDKMIDKLDEISVAEKFRMSNMQEFVKERWTETFEDLKAIEQAVKDQKEVESVSINNPEAITGDLKAGLQGIIEALKTELKNFDKNIVVKNDFSNFASLFKSSQDKKSVIEALKKIEDKIKEPEYPEPVDYTSILSDIANAVEDKEATTLLKQIVEKELDITFPTVMDVNLNPNLIDDDRVRTVLPDDQVDRMSKIISEGNNSVPIVNSLGDILDRQDTLAEYQLTNFDCSGDPFYIGAVNEDGKWYIERVNVTSGVAEFTKGDTDYSTNWTNKASLTYDTFNNIF